MQWVGVVLWNLTLGSNNSLWSVVSWIARILGASFRQLYQSVERVIYRRRNTDRCATARNIAIQRINLRALPAIQVLRG